EKPGVWDVPMGRIPVWRLSSLCVPHDRFGTGNVDDRRVLDRDMALEMWRAEADRGFALWSLRRAHATCSQGPLPIRRCADLIAWRPGCPLVLHSVQLQIAPLCPGAGRSGLLQCTNTQILVR